MRSILLLLIAVFVYSQQNLLLGRGPINRICRPACRRGYSCVLGQCTPNQTPTVPTKPTTGTCENNDTCQNGYCLPNICAPCPYDQGVQCIWHMPCPDGFDCNNGKCIKNCSGKNCKAKTCAAIFM